MAINALVQAINVLQRQDQEYQESKKVEAHAQHYQDLSRELTSLQRSWAPVQSVYRLAVAVEAAVPSDWADLRNEVKNLLKADFQTFEKSYLSKEGVGALRILTHSLVQRLDQMKTRLQKGIATMQQQALDSVDDLMARVRIRRQCGLPTNETGVQALRHELMKLFSMLNSLKPSAAQQRWQELKLRLTELGKSQSLQDIGGVSTATIAFLQRLMSDDKNRPTLADLSPEIFAEMQRFPSLLSGVHLMRKGDAR